MTERDKSSVLDAVGGLALGIALGLLVLYCFCSCSRDTLPPTQTVRLQDSATYEHIRTQSILQVPVVLPLQTSERTSRDSASHLENDFAASDARILPDGSLFHSLVTKQEPVTVGVPATADTIREKEYVEVPVEMPVPYPVERDLTRWERFKIDYGGAAVGILAAFAAAVIAWAARRFRRK